MHTIVWKRSLLQIYHLSVTDVRYDSVTSSKLHVMKSNIAIYQIYMEYICKNTYPLVSIGSIFRTMIRYRISTISYVHQIIMDKFHATMGSIITQLLFAAEKVYLCFFICQRDHSDFFNSITYINMNHLSSCIKVYTISLQELPYRVKYKHTLFII